MCCYAPYHLLRLCDIHCFPSFLLTLQCPYFSFFLFKVDLQEFVGGPEHIHLLLPPLELLANVEEFSIRASLMEAASFLLVQMPVGDVADHFLPMVQRLVAKEWFPSRMSACFLIPLAMGALRTSSSPTSSMDEAVLSSLFDWFVSLARDETPMVRRSAIMNLWRLADELVGEGNGGNDEQVAMLLSLFKELTEDAQDSVRIQAIDNLPHLAFSLRDVEQPSDSLSTHFRSLITIANQLGGDVSWRVRWTLASKYASISAAFSGKEVEGEGKEEEEEGGTTTRRNTAKASPSSSLALSDRETTSLCDTFRELLTDNEAEVRTAACKELAKVGESLDAVAFNQAVIPALSSLANDQSEFVRKSLASEINNLAPTVGREGTIAELLPLLLLLLRDEVSDVRLGVMGNLKRLHEVIGVDLLAQSLLPAIVELAEDNKWRVRLAVIELVPMLAKQLGEDFFNQRLIGLSLSWLSDCVHQVRVAAASNICALTAQFGEDWFESHILAELKRLVGDHAHTQRISAIHIIRFLAQTLSTQSFSTMLLPPLRTLAEDRVPNIRLTVAKSLTQICNAQLQVKEGQRVEGGMQELKEELKKIKGALVADSDRDVRFYANLTTECFA